MRTKDPPLLYTKIEKGVRSVLRENINIAESTEDVKKFFVYAAKELLDHVLEGQVSVNYEHITLAPDEKEGFTLSRVLLRNRHFKQTWNDSDLRHILSRMAEVALKRYKHLEKHLDKTEAKIFQDRGNESEALLKPQTAGRQFGCGRGPALGTAGSGFSHGMFIRNRVRSADLSHPPVS